MKITWFKNRTLIAAAVAGLLWGLAPSLGLAQDDEPGWLNVRVIEVKPDKAAEWEQLQEQRSEAIKKAGLPGRDIWEVVRGDIDVYHIVNRVQNLGGNDEPQPDLLGEAGFQQWISRVNQCVGDRQVLTLRRMPELSIPAKEGRKPNLAMLRLRTTGPAQGQAYRLPQGRPYPGAKESESRRGVCKPGLRGRQRSHLGFFHAGRQLGYL